MGNTEQPMWRHSIANDSNTEDYIEKSVYSHPLIICDSDVNSDVTSFLPSVPSDELDRYYADIDDEKRDGDDLLIQTTASFTGFFKAAPTNFEFKRDDITKPKAANVNDENVKKPLGLSPFVHTNFIAKKDG